MSTLFENTETDPVDGQLSETPTQAPQVSPALAGLIQSSGLEPTKQNEIAATLSTFFDYAGTWTKTVDELTINDPSETGKMQMARAGRLDLRAKRLEAEKLVDAKRASVKAAKSAFDLEDTLWLKAGQMMVAQFKHLEGLLEEKEKFAERYAAAERAKLAAERLAELAPLGFNDPSANLGAMSPETYEAIKSGLEKQKADREEAERKAEADRIAAEQAAIEERRRIEEENARLKAEAEAKEKELAAEREAAEKQRKTDLAIRESRASKLRPYIVFIRDYEKTISLEAGAFSRELDNLEEAKRLQDEHDAKVDRERIEAEAKAKAEREAIEAQAAKERAEAAAKLKAEQDRIAELERIAKAKEAAELAEKARIEEQRIKDEMAAKIAAEKAAKAPKKEKLTAWIDGATLALPAEFSEDPTVLAILQKFEAFKGWAKSQIDAL